MQIHVEVVEGPEEPVGEILPGGVAIRRNAWVRDPTARPPLITNRKTRRLPDRPPSRF
ncbi:MAG: hypothetical protein IPN69_00590 [Acidobacteria bacterium]|nr:hypothetical protein [Acidobacteriota bacterium]